MLLPTGALRNASASLENPVAFVPLPSLTFPWHKSAVPAERGSACSGWPCRSVGDPAVSARVASMTRL